MNQTVIPSLFVEGDSIPQAYFRAIKAVWENGLRIRTEYDRKNDAGEYIDPPSRDARVMVSVLDPFAQPRFAPISFCEIGTYIAEILGAKDHWVVPMEILEGLIDGEEISTTLWPYTYHGRITAHQDANGRITDQLSVALEKLAQTPFTRRAIVSTAIPDLDPYLKEDIPCLREIIFRCPEDEDGSLVLNVSAFWRSRDLYKAWGDNMIGLTFWFQCIARKLAKMTGRPVKVGSYTEFCASLHIYGQDFGHVAGNGERGLKSFFDTFNEESFVTHSFDSETAGEMLVIPQLEGLLSEQQIAQWQFPNESIELIKRLIFKLKTGQLIA